LLVVSSALGRVVADLVAPRVFTAGGMGPVTLMAGVAAIAALLVVLLGVREVATAAQDEAVVS
jgi:hypothetical protein